MFYSHSKQITYPWYMCERYDMATVQRGHQREHNETDWYDTCLCSFYV